MPVYSPNVVAPTAARSSGKRQGKIVVGYRDVRGRTRDAIVVGLATDTVAGHLKLLVSSGTNGSMGLKDNVAIATGQKQTNVYFLR